MRTALIAELQERHDEIVKYVRGLDLSKANAQQIHCLLLLARMVELTGGALALFESRRSAGVPVLLRAVLEAFVDLSNLYKDAGYGSLMHFEYVGQYIRFLKSAATGTNPWLRALAEQPGLKDRIKTMENEREELKNAGVQNLKIKDKFELADMANEYESQYNNLCSESHNDLRALYARYGNIAGGEPLTIYLDPPPEGDLSVIVSLGTYLLVSTECVGDLFGDPRVGKEQIELWEVFQEECLGEKVS